MNGIWSSLQSLFHKNITTIKAMLICKYFDIPLVQQTVIKFKDEYSITQFQQQPNHWSLKYDFWGQFLSWNETIFVRRNNLPNGIPFFFLFAYIKVRGFFLIFFILSFFLTHFLDVCYFKFFNNLISAPRVQLLSFFFCIFLYSK